MMANWDVHCGFLYLMSFTHNDPNVQYSALFEDNNVFEGRYEILEVALPVPLRKTFDYRLPQSTNPISAYSSDVNSSVLDGSDKETAQLSIGTRVTVSFGHRVQVGVIVGYKQNSSLPISDLKPITEILERDPAINRPLMVLGQWIARYYHQPIGDVMTLMLPPLLRKPHSLLKKNPLLAKPHLQLKLIKPNWQPKPNAVKQQRLLAYFKTLASDQQCSLSSVRASVNDLKQHSFTLAQLKTLATQGIVEFESSDFKETDNPIHKAVATADSTVQTSHPMTQKCHVFQEHHPLTTEQHQVLSQLPVDRRFACTLLEGVTGSGKTQVYLSWLQQIRATGKQALVLIPEIGLTEQTVERFQKAFGETIAFLHSGVTHKQRLQVWQSCREGKVSVLIGTRSALFTPFKCLGAIVIDEEQDASFRQQDQVRYCARDAAIKYAQILSIPILLGSATPSLETLRNTALGRYQHCRLTHRATNSPLPRLFLKDVRYLPKMAGIANFLIQKMQEKLLRGEQVMVFLNRRGFAPRWSCQDCGWVAICRHCDALLTVHSNPPSLKCHHCQANSALLNRCPQCHSHRLGPLGQGTEQLEDTLARELNFPVVRIDRDTTKGRADWQRHLHQIRSGEPLVIVGTQMLSKGHHFEHLNWVLVMDMDSTLFSTDERALERSAQLFHQVAGRSGREQAGEVFVQTHYPDHPWLRQLISQPYTDIAASLLQDKKNKGFPPFGYSVLIKADSPSPLIALQWLEAAQLAFEADLRDAVIQGPEPAAMELKQGRFRARWQWTFPERSLLHERVNRFEQYAASKKVHKLRWVIEIDPVDSD